MNRLMKSFISDNFLLENEFSQELYHSYAKTVPIIDYHNHLPVGEIADNREFENMTRLWLEGDHYKWRAMRSLGLEEKYITGSASDEEKFEKWAYTVPYTMRNPLYHWSHLELKRYFDIDQSLNERTAADIYKQCNSLLGSKDFFAQGLLKQMNVELLCTSDDPLDDLKEHQILARSDFGTSVLPTFRPDRFIDIEKAEFKNCIDQLAELTNTKIDDLDSLVASLRNRVSYFHDCGCRLADHGLPYAYAHPFSRAEVDGIIKKRLLNNRIDKEEELKFKSALLFYMGIIYAEFGWTSQLHLGPIRDTNKAMLDRIGINAGVDSIGDFPQAEHLANFLNHLNENDGLPKTIIYNSNPADNDIFATMTSNFSEEGIKTKVQFGAAWWFLDQMDGIENQIKSISNMGLLSCSVGMVTDSRSFVSFPRHEYYRRVLCGVFGNDIKKGLLPADLDWIGGLIKDICYRNAKEFFHFPEKKTP